MIEQVADLWTVPAQVRCVTTNGVVTQGGQAVMGGGCALEAREKFEGIDYTLGHLLEMYGNHVHIIYVYQNYNEFIVSFPTKGDWKTSSEIALIEQSCRELVELADRFHFDNIIVPRPGAGLGGLFWSDVKPVCERYFDDRFMIVSY